MNEIMTLINKIEQMKSVCKDKTRILDYDYFIHELKKLDEKTQNSLLFTKFVKTH